MDEDTRVEHLWFSSDVLVLRAEKRLFRVPKSILAARSSVFRDMVAFPQPTDSETEMVDGSPVVVLHDSAAEVEMFLTAIFDSSYFMPPPAPVTPEAVLGILRLAHKYDVHYLQLRALQHLCIPLYFPSVREHCSPSIPDHHVYNGDTDKARCAYYIQAITVAKEAGALWLLPVSYYQASSYVRAHLLEAAEQGADKHVVDACLASQIHLSRASGSIYKFLSTPSDTGCPTPDLCNATRFDELSSYFDGCGGEEDLCPLSEWDEEDGWTLPLCAHCLSVAKTTHRTAMEEIWDRLPAIYGLPPWSELQSMKDTMMAAPSAAE
ncbi:hypothetical protein B0H16DRAFT_1734640 [Mycena metata]|uniref:BTB domain-containing protein n=1 Tax=Mycena metata TaxID=1033252 RepID=A0AAD7HVE1_9AGAR|nr:hypothetical protein B0H16DRAFT_1734640 [Mycena metata]